MLAAGGLGVADGVHADKRGTSMTDKSVEVDGDVEEAEERLLLGSLGLKDNKSRQRRETVTRGRENHVQSQGSCSKRSHQCSCTR